MKNFKTYILFALLVAFFVSCKKKNSLSQAETDENTIKKYIADNNLNAQKTSSGLYYVISSPGSGLQPIASSIVTVKYDGFLIDGSVFDQSTATGASFPLSNVIKGWQEGIPLFKKGGKGVLLIPSALGYGEQATGKIPANSVLIFNIELLDVK
jgi:FKBP-type peptidyl-prolyl cis-trans isomerase FkpA